MTDTIRIDLNNIAAQIWQGKAKADLVDGNGPLFPAAFIAELIEVADGSVAIGDIWNGSAFSKPANPASTRVDGGVFLERVTDAEYAAVTAAAVGSVQLQRWLDQLRMLGYVDVASASAVAAKAGLVSAGLLTQDRADAIFAGP